MNIKDCEGCNTYEVTHKRCITISTIIKIGDVRMICPCSICLVKSMCSYPCDKMKKFYHKITILNEDYI